VPGDVLIIGAGIGGLTLALELHRAGIPCRIYEAASEIAPAGVGINVLPHASAILAELGLEEALGEVAVTTREQAFFNRFGQLIYREPAGRAAGHSTPQFSVHRADLQAVLSKAVTERIGADRLNLGWRCCGVRQNGAGVHALFDGHEPQQAAAVIGCDGIHSVVRRQLHPDEGEPRYSGVNMWRGVTVGESFLTGASMVRAGWLATGKLVVYPIRDNVDAAGRQVINWVAEIETPGHQRRDWNRSGSIADFIGAFEDWTFDWLDVPALIGSTATVLEFPMVDQDPLDFWGTGKVTLLGDAAHPMVPRGSNGAGQAILDAQVLARELSRESDTAAALRAYEAIRLPATAAIVIANRTNPPDAILREVYTRTGDKPFRNIDDVISPSELRGITERYRQVSMVREPHD
jgi:2-polyprenyl-6-methoxyphenol hydroxylase-like FAD-dependent oxidoreductase